MSGCCLLSSLPLALSPAHSVPAAEFTLAKRWGLLTFRALSCGARQNTLYPGVVLGVGAVPAPPPRALWVVPAPQHGRPRAHPRPGFCLRTLSRGKLLSQPTGTLLSSEFVSVVCRVRVTVHRLQHSRKTCSVKLLLLFGELRRQHINY